MARLHLLLGLLVALGWMACLAAGMDLRVYSGDENALPQGHPTWDRQRPHVNVATNAARESAKKKDHGSDRRAVTVRSTGSQVALPLIFDAEYSQWQIFTLRPPDFWWQMIGSPRRIPPIDAVRTESKAFCSSVSPLGPCSLRHCAWDLGYPSAESIVIPSRMLNTSTSLCELYALHLFHEFDLDGNGCLSRAEWDSVFIERHQRHDIANSINPFLVKAKSLDPDRVFQLVDLNRNGLVEHAEFIVAEHFWMMTHLAKTAPTGSIDVLGGLFLDQQTWEVFQHQSVHMERPHYTTLDLWTYKLRPPTQAETARTFAKMDLDGSGRYSVDEHYFYNWADQDRSGVLELREFEASLFVLPTPVDPTNPPASYVTPVDLFSRFDKDGNNLIDFLEIKFETADENNDRLLTRVEWLRGDFPAEQFELFDFLTAGQEPFGPTLADILGERKYIVDPIPDGVIGEYEYLLYIQFSNCTTPTIDSIASNYTWNVDNCPLSFHFQGLAPLLAPPVNSEAGWEQWPTGTLGNLVRAVAEVHGWALERNQFLTKANYTNDPSTVAESTLVNEAAIQGTTGQIPVYDIGVFATPIDGFGIDGAKPSSLYYCSEAIGPAYGLHIVVPRDVRPKSNNELTPLIIVSPSFFSLIAILILLSVFMGNVFWLIEHFAGTDAFPDTYVHGVLAGCWFSVVTLTTIGYGDMNCKSPFGKIATVLWMIIGIIFFSVLSGNVTSQFEEEKRRSIIAQASDITGLGVGVLSTFLAGPDQSDVLGYSPRSPRGDVGYYSSVSVALDDLLSKRQRAIVMPRSQLLMHCNQTSDCIEDCGELKFKLIGGEIDNTVPQLRVCMSNRHGQIGKYIVAAFREAMKEIDMSSIEEDPLSTEVEARTREAETPCSVIAEYNIPFLSTSLVLVVVIIILFNILTKQHNFHRHGKVLLKAIEFLFVTRENKYQRAARYAKLWLTKTRASIHRRAMSVFLSKPENLGSHVDIFPVTLEMHASVRTMKKSAKVVLDQIRHLRHDSRAFDREVGKVVTFFTLMILTNLGLICVLTITFLQLNR